MTATDTASRRLELVRAYIAHSILPPLPPATLGAITLAPHQRDAAARLLAIIAQHHGALLADEVGLGKTYVALAVAREYEHCHVIAPASLLTMWAAAIARTSARATQLHSLHAFSTTAPPSLPMQARTLVIVDEAHHLRNATTTRYRHVAHAVADADVLLLSATPLHNRARDLRALLALCVGNRDDVLTEQHRSALIVRRDATTLRETAALRGAATNRDTNVGVVHPEGDANDARYVPATLPTVRTHQPWRIALDEQTLARIVTLPAPLPARAGAEAGALIRMGLLRAWCSSDAALADALRARRLRGAVLRDALLVGRHPTERELRSWAIGGDDAQLGFAELLTETTVASGPLLEVLERHLEALQQLAAHHREHMAPDGTRPSADRQRAHLLRAVLTKHRDSKVVAFSQHARTVQALYRALSDIAGVGMLTGARARIASGPLARWDAIGRFAPRAQERPPPPAHQAIRLLLTTDILAEGVNLQDADVVVHLDLPWTAALRDQRVGRCARMGSAHAIVHVYRVAPSLAVERVVRLEQRVARKARLGARAIGAASTPHEGAVIRGALRASRLHERLARWRCNDDARVERAVAHANAHATPDDARGDTRERLFAQQHSPQPGALVVVQCDGRTTLLAVQPRGGIWRATARPSAVETLLRAAQGAEALNLRPARQAAERRDHALVGTEQRQMPREMPPEMPPELQRQMQRETRRAVRQAVRRWLQARAVGRAVGRDPRALSAVQRQALARVAAATGTVSVTGRLTLAAAWSRARRAILAVRTPAGEQALRTWLADLPPASDAARTSGVVSGPTAGLAAWLTSVPMTSAPAEAEAEREHRSGQLLGMLLLTPD